MTTSPPAPVLTAPTGSARRSVEALKAGLLTEGAIVSARAEAWLFERFGGTVTVHEYATTGGLTIDLGHGVLVNAPIDEWFCETSSLLLDVVDDGLVVRDGSGLEQPVAAVIPLPGYLDAVDASGRRATSTCFTHADRIRLSPIVGCAYQCDYCNLPAERYARREPEQLLAALEIALADRNLPPRHVLISGGSPGSRHVGWFEETVGSVVSACPLPVDVMMAAVDGDPGLASRLVDRGVTGFSINLELHSEGASQLHIRGKHRHARPGFEAFVSAAVERLGSTGAVRSLIIGGLEPPDETLAGIELIARLGADPVLSPFRPAERTSLADRRPPTAASMLDLLDRGREVAHRHGVRLGPDCIPCQHNTLAFPWDR